MTLNQKTMVRYQRKLLVKIHIQIYWGYLDHNYNKERRIERGLFQAKDKLINADVNGSLQIMRKVFPDSYTGYGIEVDLTPTIINAV